MSDGTLAAGPAAPGHQPSHPTHTTCRLAVAGFAHTSLGAAGLTCEMVDLLPLTTASSVEIVL